MSDPVLEVCNLYCERDDRELFSDLSFSLSAGEIMQIEGPNGSGKTTLLRSLCGLSSRYEGDILWRGESVRRHRPQFFSEMLYLGHAGGIKAALTPRENLTWQAGLRGEDPADIDRALDQVGLYGFEDMPCYLLSAGQQRRVNLARLFLLPAALWVLDEPFTAIDKQGVKELESWIEQHADNGGMVILTTHHQLITRRVIKRVMLGEWQ